LKSTARQRESWFEDLEYKTDFNADITAQLQEMFRETGAKDKQLSAIAASRFSYAGMILPYEEQEGEQSPVPVVTKQPKMSPSLNISAAKYLFTLDNLPKKASLVYFRKDGTDILSTTIGSIESDSVKIDVDSLRAVRFGTPIFTLTE
jgi:hypothetical protein